MKKTIINKLRLTLAATLLALGFVAVPTSVFADSVQGGLQPVNGGSTNGQLQQTGGNATQQLCSGATGNTNCTTTGPSVPKIINTVVNVLTFIIGAVSVIFIVIGGLRYVISNGDQSQVTAAKNTILYAVVGLVVAIAAFGIVTFVIGQFK